MSEGKGLNTTLAANAVWAILGGHLLGSKGPRHYARLIAEERAASEVKASVSGPAREDGPVSRKDMLSVLML